MVSAMTMMNFSIIREQGLIRGCHQWLNALMNDGPEIAYRWEMAHIRPTLHPRWPSLFFCHGAQSGGENSTLKAALSLWGSYKACALVTTAPISKRTWECLDVWKQKDRQRGLFFLTALTRMRTAHHQRAIKSLLHYSELRQTPAPLRLGEWDH